VTILNASTLRRFDASTLQRFNAMRKSEYTMKDVSVVLDMTKKAPAVRRSTAR